MPDIGHGSAMYYRDLGSGAAWTLVGHTQGDFTINTSKAEVMHFPWSSTTMRDYVPGTLTVDTISFEVAYTYGDATHDDLEVKHFSGTKFELRFVGPGGSANNHETIFPEGFLTSFQRSYPNEDGLQTATLGFRPCKTIIVNGNTYP